MRLKVLLPGVVAIVVAGAAVALALDPGGSCDIAYVGTRMTGVERSRDVVALDEKQRVVRTLTSDGQSLGPVFSPDGERIAYLSGRGYPATSEHGNEKQSIYLMDAGGGNERRLTDGHQDSALAWSPDGTRLAFLRRPASGSRLQVVVVDVASGAERVVVGERPLVQVDWLDDATLVFTAYTGKDLTVDMYKVPASGGTPVKMLEDVSERVVWNPERTAFLRGARGGETKPALRLVTVADGGERVIAGTESAATGAQFWTKDGTIVYVVNARGDGVNLFARDGVDGSPRLVAFLPDDGAAASSYNPRCAP